MPIGSVEGGRSYGSVTVPTVDVDFGRRDASGLVGGYLCLGDQERNARFGKTMTRQGKIVSAFITMAYSSGPTPALAAPTIVRLWENSALHTSNFIGELRVSFDDANQQGARLSNPATMYTGTLTEYDQTGLDADSETEVDYLEVYKGRVIVAEFESFGGAPTLNFRAVNLSLAIELKMNT